MAERKDYYEILGLPHDCSEDDIKKAYRKLAKKYHPDRWVGGTEEEKKEAEEKFKDIAEANGVLSDPQKRQMYDNGGMNFNEGFDPMADFMRNFAQSDFFGGGFGDGFGGFRKKTNRGSNIDAFISLTLSEAYNGAKKTISFDKEEPCSHCNGSGSEDGKAEACPYCHGSGQSRVTTNQGNAIFTQISVCPHCGGTGKKITKPCHHCGGTGMEKHPITMEINIPRGAMDGMTLYMEQMGNAPASEGVNGDLLIHVSVAPDPYFTVADGINLVHYEDVPFNECLLGFKKKVKAIDGTEIEVKADELTPFGKTFIFNGKGMPNPKDPSTFGDLAVVIRYKLPDRLTDEQKEKLRDF